MNGKETQVLVRVKLGEATLDLTPEQARALWAELDALFGDQPAEGGQPPVYVPLPYPSASAWPQQPPSPDNPTWGGQGRTTAGTIKS